jgi:hypothetical protein
MPRNKKQLPIKDIITSYQEGNSLRAIAKQYNTTDTTIKNRLIENDVPIRSFSESLKQKQARKLIAEAQRGNIPWNKGLTKKTDCRVMSYSKRLKGRILSESTKEKIRQARQKHKWFSTCQGCGSTKGMNRSRLCCFCAAAYRVAKYPNGMKGKKLSKTHKKRLLASSRRQRMTTPEKHILDILQWMFNSCSPYKYSGSGPGCKILKLKNGRHKRPDFVNEFDKKIIEVYGRYWHRNDNPKELIDEYKKIGWSCLVIWDDEININVRDIIMEFTYPYEYQEELKEINKI